jgi:hypothetical protein
MRWFVGSLLVLALGAVALWRFVLFPPETPPDPSLACHHAAYDLSDGRIVWFGVTQFPGAYRYHLMSGVTGVMRPEPGGEAAKRKRYTAGPGWDLASPVVASMALGSCDDPAIAFETGGQRLTGVRREVEATEARFESVGVNLVGQLILPKGPGPFPIVVLVHGSENTSGIWNNRLRTMFPANGIGVFVYDKRGTGRSEGRYTQDFHVLAADAAAAMARAKVMAGLRGSQFGYQGGSQAGWVIPLAVQKSGADFSIVAFGLAEGPLAEDREQVMSELRARGYGPDTLAKAREVTDVTGRIMASNFREGFDELAAIKARYGVTPWFAQIEGEFTGDFLRNPPWLLQLIGPWFGVGTTWTHDPVPVLKTNTQPSLWLLAGKDREAPSENTVRILRELQTSQPQLDVIVFPNADHGLVDVVEEKGELRDTNFSPGYFETMAAWIKTQRLDAPAPGAAKYEGGAGEPSPLP